MKAKEQKLLSFLKQAPQFQIPIYQRTYSWTEVECRQLFEDILRVGTEDAVPAHFVGSVVYIESGLYQVSDQEPLLVIDGQQRLTTVALILEALARLLPNGKEPIDGFSAEKIRSYYLMNPLESGDRRHKLLLTKTDRETLLAIIEGGAMQGSESIRLRQNFEFLSKSIVKVGEDLAPICKGLAKLMIVDISLSRDQDNPQLIFESMNATGRALTQADMVRNYVLMGLKPDHQLDLYSNYWQPMEAMFGQATFSRHFDSFMRHYVTCKTDDIPTIRDVYKKFKELAQISVAQRGIDELVEDIKTFAGYYCAMALGREEDPELRDAFGDLRELKVDVAYPLLLPLYHDYKHMILRKAELLQIVRLIESYVFRRAVCGIPTNSLNNTFAQLGKDMKNVTGDYVQAIRSFFQLLPSYRRFPEDMEFFKEIKVRDLYNFRSRSYWLRRFENFERKERVSVDEYTIEHIMPQNRELSQEWREDLGSDWEDIHGAYLHTLGNLTLTGYNSEYSDRPFREKRDMKGGFARSPLMVNEGLGELSKWDQSTIIDRSEQMAKKAVEVWEGTNVSVDYLSDFEAKVKQRNPSISVDDYWVLNSNKDLRELFMTLRRRILSLDNCVSEELHTRYVSYNAEASFVDVILQDRRICLQLNLQLSELVDDRRIAIDSSGSAHYGEGDVQVLLEKAEDIPYVVGLIRQALERQMGDSET